MNSLQQYFFWFLRTFSFYMTRLLWSFVWLLFVFSQFGTPMKPILGLLDPAFICWLLLCHCSLSLFLCTGPWEDSFLFISCYCVCWTCVCVWSAEPRAAHTHRRRLCGLLFFRLHVGPAISFWVVKPSWQVSPAVEQLYWVIFEVNF